MLIIVSLGITTIMWKPLSPSVLIPLTVSMFSLALGAYSVSISIKSDKKTEKVREYILLSALDNLEDIRFELRDKSTLNLCINIWKARDTFKRVLTLESSKPKYNQRKINYIKYYFAQLIVFLKETPRMPKGLTTGARKENIKHINWIYNHLDKIKGITRKEKAELKAQRDEIIDIMNRYTLRKTKYEEYLEGGTIDPKLKEALNEKHDCDITDDAELFNKGGRWIISENEKKKYFMKIDERRKGRINIY